MDLRVDPDGLRADAGALDASAHQSAPASACPAAAGDSVSTHLASALSAWAQSLHLLHDHAGQQRAVGGIAVGGTATNLAGADDTNAASIGGIMNGAAPTGGAPAAPSVGALPEVPVPSLPAIPTLAAPMPMAPEQVAAQVHSGPGPQTLRSFAAHIRSTLATSVLNTASEVRSTGTSVARNWDDGQQQAATNIARHADWLESSLHPQVLALASAADAAATHTDTLIQNTPHPQEFTDLRQRLNVALANYNASGGANAAQVEALSNELTTKRAAAMSAFQDFSTAAPPTIGGAASPPQPAPPIAHSPSGTFQTLNPHGPAKSSAEHEGPAAGRGHHGEGDNEADGPTSADHPPVGTPTTAGNHTATAPLPSPADPSSTNMLANVAGMIMGAGTGAVGQVTHGLGGASPLSALSSLSSLPGMGGMPHLGTPEMPDTGGGSGSPSDDAGSDFGSGGTTPAAGGGGDGGGGGAPMSSSSPAVGPPAGSSLAVGSPATAAPTGTGMAGGGMGMMPHMGGMGGKNDEGRKSEDRRRVVERPMPNTEAVFGEVRRTTRRRREPDKKT